MSRIVGMVFMVVWMVSCKEVSRNKQRVEENNASLSEYAIVIHGGAGSISPEHSTPAKLAEYKSALNNALDIGEGILKSGGSALDAVEKTINYLEDSPLFNAGRGAVFTYDGKNEMDASIMVGSNHMAGAVGGVTTIKNPISAARAVMEKSKHVLLTGHGAEIFAQEVGLEIEDPSYFRTESRWKSLQRILQKEREGHASQPTGDEKHGTVGCVALDKMGHIVAGTSTGGMSAKRYGRLGDSPIIGAGTYADDRTCGVSSTGHGEYFIRFTVARDIAAQMEYGGKSLQEAADDIINHRLVDVGGSGGIIAIDHRGHITMPFNTKSMFRGYAKPGERSIKIFKD